MEQDILGLGLDIGGFDDRKRAVLNEYIALFDKLSQYDGKVFNPILGSGLTEFNSSIAQTGKLLDEINAKILLLGNSIKSTNNSSKSGAAKSVSDLASETNKYKSSTDAASASTSKLSLSTSQQAKEQAALKLQLSETTKSIVSNTKSVNESSDAKGLARIKSQEYRLEQRRVVETLRALAIQQDKDAEDLIKNSKKKDAESKARQAQMQRESLLTKNLTNDYYALREALKDQAINYSNLYVNAGKNAPETKAALAEYAATAGVISDIDKKLASAEPKAFGLGKGLSSMYNQLRIIAYILPGVGIAGIFNLAFEAIQKSTSGMNLFNDSVSDYYDSQTALNKLLKDQFDIYEDIIKSYKELRSLQDGARFNQKDIIGLQGSQGYDPITLLNNKKVEAEKEYLQVTGDILKETGNSPETLKLYLDRKLSLQKAYSDQITDLSKRINAAEHPNPSANKVQTDINGRRLDIQGTNEISEKSLARLKKEKDEIQAKLDLEKDSYKKSTDLLVQYQSSQVKLEEITTSLHKAQSDDKLKKDSEYYKENISLNKEKNDKILNDDLSTEKQKLEAIREINRLNKGLNKRELDDVLLNISSTQGEKDIAGRKYTVSNRKDDIQTEIALNALREQYRQKRLDAQRDIDKSILESSASVNERIYQNEEKSLSDRLKSYATYVNDKQKIQDIEYQRDIDVLSLKTGDPTAQLQIQALKDKRDQQKVSEQADVENKVYDIVFSSLKKQLKAVTDENSLESKEDEKKYTIALNKLNNSYDNRRLSYEKYRKALKDIEKKYTISGLDEEIDRDIKNIERLNNLLNSTKEFKKGADSEVETAQIGVTVADQFGGDKNAAKKSLDTAVGKQKAAASEIIQIGKDLASANDKLTDDENKKAKAGITTKKDDEGDWYKYAIKIERQLYQSIKSFADQAYQYRLDLVEKNKALIDEQYGYEISAIEKSSLTAKDKAALDIQLAEQKKEFDKKALLDEKRIKVEQAEFDKKLSITHIILNTAEAIMAGIPPSPKSTTAAIIGGIELGVAVATPIPSFKEGVKGFKGGMARFGEDGSEILKMPYKSPLLIEKETISYLPPGTDIIPINKNFSISERKIDDGWEQTIWLSKQIRKSVRQPNIKNVNIINIDSGFENYRRRILGT